MLPGRNNYHNSIIRYTNHTQPTSPGYALTIRGAGAGCLTVASQLYKLIYINIFL